MSFSEFALEIVYCYLGDILAQKLIEAKVSKLIAITVRKCRPLSDLLPDFFNPWDVLKSMMLRQNRAQQRLEIIGLAQQAQTIWRILRREVGDTAGAPRIAWAMAFAAMLRETDGCGFFTLETLNSDPGSLRSQHEA